MIDPPGDGNRQNGSIGARLIAAERARQIDVEQWFTRHDDQHLDGELVAAAICYAEAGSGFDLSIGQKEGTKEPRLWPWESKWWKPTDDLVRNLAKAGALIAAEIDRLHRESGEDDGLTTGADSADSGVTRTVNAEARDPHLPAASSADPLPSEDIEAARNMLSTLCHFVWNGKVPPGAHLWSIPADRERDFDLMFSALFDELEERRKAAADPALRTLSQQWRESADNWDRVEADAGCKPYAEGAAKMRRACAADLDRLCPEIRDEQK